MASPKPQVQSKNPLKMAAKAIRAVFALYTLGYVTQIG
jgi:hypothetical protein